MGKSKVLHFLWTMLYVKSRAHSAPQATYLRGFTSKGLKGKGKRERKGESDRGDIIISNSSSAACLDILQALDGRTKGTGEWQAPHLSLGYRLHLRPNRKIGESSLKTDIATVS